MSAAPRSPSAAGSAVDHESALLAKALAHPARVRIMRERLAQLHRLVGEMREDAIELDRGEDCLLIRILRYDQRR